MKIWFIIMISILSCSNANAQTLRAYEKAGDEALSKQDYYSAYVYFQEAIHIDTSILRLKYKFAKAAFHWQSFDEANLYFKMSNTDEISKQFPEFEYDWGLNQMALGKYEEAIELFQGFLKKGGLLQRKRKIAKSKIKACQNASSIINKPIEITIQTLGENINSPYSEFAPLQWGEDLYFSSLKFKKSKRGKEEYFSRILSQKGEEKAKPLKKNINLKDIHNAHITFSRDSNWLYFTRCENIKTGGIRCEIYRRDLRERRAKDELLPDFINLEGFTATQPYIGFDKTGKREWLFFASDRKGGKGGMDIWSSEIKPDGTFAKPRNLGRNINSIGDEITPFYQNKTLYFSSNEHIGLGGFDIFKAKNTGNNQWSVPQNMGFPLNGSYNDIYFVLNDDGYTGFFSTNRKGTILLTKSACCNDIFAFQFPKPKVEEPEIPPTDTLITAIEEKPKIDTIPIVQKQPTFEDELSKMLPIALYFDNDHPNPRTTKTTTPLSYEETYLSYFAKKDVFLDKISKPLSGQKKIEAQVELEAFFENEVKFSYNNLIRLSSLLLIELNKGKTYTIYIKGYTSRLASSDYNISLSKRRISSVKNFLETFQGGIFESFLKNEQLKIIEVPFGETKSKEDAKVSRIQSIYSVDASRERRVEIIEVK